MSKTINLEFANLDIDRAKRTGAPECIFCQGKTKEQISEIFARLTEAHPGENIMGTRADEEDYQEVIKRVPEAKYDPCARIIYTDNISPNADGPAIAVVTAGTSDIPVAEEAALTAEILGNRVKRIYDVGVAGVHRLLEHEEEINSCQVVIVVAGMEGALASVVGGFVKAPVIAVPTSVGYGANFEGLSALLAMLNSCANGVGVVNIDNGYGAACLANKILKIER